MLAKFLDQPVDLERGEEGRCPAAEVQLLDLAVLVISRCSRYRYASAFSWLRVMTFVQPQ